MIKNRFTKYEEETIILIKEGDDTYTIYILDIALKGHLADSVNNKPVLCRLMLKDKKTRCQELCE